MKWKKKSSILYHLTYNLSKSLCTSKSAIFYLFIYLFIFLLFNHFTHLPWQLRLQRISLPWGGLGFNPWVRKIPSRRKRLIWTEEPVRLQSMGWKKVGHDWVTNTHTHTHNHFTTKITRLHPGGSDGKASAYNSGDSGSIPGLGRSPGEWNCNPLQYSCLKNAMDGGTW